MARIPAKAGTHPSAPETWTNGSRPSPGSRPTETPRVLLATRAPRGSLGRLVRNRRATGRPPPPQTYGESSGRRGGGGLGPGIFPDHRGALLADHDGRRVGGAGGHRRHYRGVDHPTSGGAAHP